MMKSSCHFVNSALEAPNKRMGTGKNKYCWFLLFPLINLLSISSHADVTFPAQFDSAEQEFLAMIDIPQLEEAETIVRCGGWLSKRGEFSQVDCYRRLDSELGKNVEDKLNRSVSTAAEKIRLTPAVVQGENTEVWVNFSVVIRQEEQKQVVQVLENHLYNEAYYGRD